MANRTQLNRRLAKLTGISIHTIDRLGVNLNRGGIILAGGRGRHAPAMRPEDLKTILLALLGSESTGRVFETVLKLHGLQTDDKRNFGDVLLDICSDAARAARVMQVSVLRNYPQASIYWRDESGVRIGKIENFHGGAEKEVPGMRVVATLSGTVLSELVGFVLASRPAENEKTAFY